MKIGRKGGMLDTALGKAVLALIALLVIIGIIWIMKDKMASVWGKLARIIRFGG